MRKGLVGLSVAMAALGMAAGAEACTASKVMDVARASKVSDTESITKDLAREVLDEAGYGADKDVAQTIGILDGTINSYRYAELTGTPLEAATGTLIMEGNADWRPYADRPQTPTEWRDLLDTVSMEHEMSFNVRGHMLYHASEFGLNPPASVLRSTARPVETAPPKAADEAPVVESPASRETEGSPAPVPAYRSPRPAPVAPPVPASVDHAG